ncbi:MAG: C69 family dipeptidase, partial [Candidatus Helarchaeota archaeon]
MCDNLVVLGNSSENGNIIFGKNSDREANEAHEICYIPRKSHSEDEMIECQYISIPQVQETFAVILSKPAWLKVGSEMGANEHGVAIGNDAVRTREPLEKVGLLGMDLITIALQRAKTAKESLDIIIELIEKYGQGGSGSRIDPSDLYHNSFIIVDLKEAWILETANKFWVAKKVKDVGSISNGLTIQKEWDLASPGLVENALEKEWCESKSEFNFTECYADPSFQSLSGCLERQKHTINNLLDNKGKINVKMVMDLLRQHEKKFQEKPFRPDKASMGSVCMHLSSKAVSQTVGSQVSDLNKDYQVHWLTGTSAPCLSVFKPFFFESPDSLTKLKKPSLTNDNSSLWWKHEKLHRIALMDYIKRAPVIIQRSKSLETKLIDEIKELLKNSKSVTKQKLNEISSTALDENFSLISNLTESISKIEIEKSPPRSYAKLWSKLS